MHEDVFFLSAILLTVLIRSLSIYLSFLFFFFAYSNQNLFTVVHIASHIFLPLNLSCFLYFLRPTSFFVLNIFQQIFLSVHFFDFYCCRFCWSRFDAVYFRFSLLFSSSSSFSSFCHLYFPFTPKDFFECNV